MKTPFIIACFAAVFSCFANIALTHSQCTPVLVSPAEGEIIDNGCVDFSNPSIWIFDWQDCPGATKYQLYVKYTESSTPRIDTDTITISYFRIEESAWHATGSWIWKVRAFENNLWGPWSEERSFNPEPVGTDCMVACTPVLSSPEEGEIMDNGCHDLSDKIKWTFEWQQCFGASKYHLYVIQEDSPVSIIDKNDISALSYVFDKFDTISGSMLDGWKWKVRAMVNDEWGSWSEERSFTVETIGSDCGGVCTPELAFPQEDAVLDNGCFDFSDHRIWEFHWTGCGETSKYHLLVKSASSTSAMIDVDTLSDPQYFEAIADWVSSTSDWSWKVRAKVDGLWGTWSEERFFTVEEPNTDCSATSLVQKESDDFNIRMYPNPFAHELTVAFFLQNTSNITIDVYNITGKLLFTADHSVRQAGQHVIKINSKEISQSDTGIVLLRFDIGGYVIYKKAVMLAD